MIFTDRPPVRSGTWLEIDDSTKISYKIEDTSAGAFANITFLGPAELELSMSEEMARRCHDLFERALAEISDPAAEQSPCPS